MGDFRKMENWERRPLSKKNLGGGRRERGGGHGKPKIQDWGCKMAQVLFGREHDSILRALLDGEPNLTKIHKLKSGQGEKKNNSKKGEGLDILS